VSAWLLPLVGKSEEEVAAALQKLDGGDADLAAATGRKPISDADVKRVMKEAKQLKAYNDKHDPELHRLPEGSLEKCVKLLPKGALLPDGALKGCDTIDKQAEALLAPVRALVRTVHVNSLLSIPLLCEGPSQQHPCKHQMSLSCAHTHVACWSCCAITYVRMHSLC
jgi:hypothetical protein